ncbi:hypothetical protein APF79_04340 [bacterium BRH_c32]|nr:MAG: hypothetical protein APF79_04340 [bacterium BRH_c32]
MKKLQMLLFSLCFFPVLLFGQNIITNPSFEGGLTDKGIPNGWLGYPQTGASLALMTDAATAHSGDNWVKLTSATGGYYLLYLDKVETKEGDVWDFSAFLKDVSPAPAAGNYAALKIAIKSVTGATFLNYEVFQEGVTGDWKKFSNRQTMPEGAAFIQATIVVNPPDNSAETAYGVDDVRLELVPKADTTNLIANFSFEDTLAATGVPADWIGYAQTGAKLEVMKDNNAVSGETWVKLTSTLGGYYLLYQNTFPAKAGETYEFSSFIKDLSPANPGAVFAALKITAKTAAGANIKAWEIYQDSVKGMWGEFSNIQTMPANTGLIQAVIVVHAADGAPEAAYGFDNVKLKMIHDNEVASTFPNYVTNPGFENGVTDKGIPIGWLGYPQTGASMEVVNKSSTALNGSNWVKATSTQGGYYLLYLDKIATKPGDVWDFSAFLKDVSPAYPGACYAALKIAIKSVTGATFLNYEIFQDSVPSYWKKFSNKQTMPEGAAFMQATIVVHGADGAPEAAYGIDDVRLELVETVADTTNLFANPGFEAGANDKGVPVGWIGYAQTGASIEFKSDMATAHSGINWAKITSTAGGYYLLYQNAFPAKEGQTWKLSSYFKDLSPAFPGANYAALKISAKSVTGATFKSWEIYPDTVTSEWAQYSNEQKLPEGTAFIQGVIVIHAADGAPEASYGVDDVRLEITNDPGTGIEDYETIPTRYELSQNYPNPFNPTTKIHYNIPREGNVTLKVYNMIGQEVASLVNENKPAGSHQVTFNAKELASGMYIYRIQVGSFMSAKKMLLIK